MSKSYLISMIFFVLVITIPALITMAKINRSVQNAIKEVKKMEKDTIREIKLMFDEPENPDEEYAKPEIERKFLIDKFPHGIKGLEYNDKYEISRRYISWEDIECRVEEYYRPSNLFSNRSFEYFLTIKSPGGLEREEIEIPISDGYYVYINNLMSMHINSKSIFITCREYILPCGNVLKCSRVDEGTENEFMYAEVEFNSTDEAANFDVPSFLGKEITNDPYYKMKNYWKRTRIENKGEQINE